MRRKPKKCNSNPCWIEVLLTICYVFYSWYLLSTLVLPLAGMINLPDKIFFTLYSLTEFPPSILGFVVCVSLISCIVVLSEFRNKSLGAKIFLIEGLTFMLYFIIPILATFFLLVLVATGLPQQIPSESSISYFIEDLFIFTSILFVLTAILNVAMQKLVRSAAYEDIGSRTNKFK